MFEYILRSKLTFKLRIRFLRLSTLNFPVYLCEISLEGSLSMQKRLDIFVLRSNTLVGFKILMQEIFVDIFES